MTFIGGDENNIKYDDGLNGHTDSNFLTFISQNQVNDLQINKNGEWIDVNISSNSYVDLSGDSFKVLLIFFLVSLITLLKFVLLELFKNISNDRFYRIGRIPNDICEEYIQGWNIPNKI